MKKVESRKKKRMKSNRMKIKKINRKKVRRKRKGMIYSRTRLYNNRLRSSRKKLSKNRRL